MAEERIKEIIEFIKHILEQGGLRVDRLVLFGSHAHGTPHKDSDLDIAVISEDFERMDIFERARTLADADIKTVKKFLVPLDLVALSPREYSAQESPISQFVREESIEYKT
jgi:predicted nucleotidyltransferase